MKKRGAEAAGDLPALSSLYSPGRLLAERPDPARFGLTPLRRRRHGAALAAVFSLGLGWATGAEALQTYDVTTTMDVVNGADGVLSLREALTLAETDNDDSQINLGVGLTYDWSMGNQTTSETDTLAINGNGSTVDAGMTSRIFDFNGGPVTIRNITLRNGLDTTDGGCIYAGAELTLEDSTVTGCQAPNGGGIYSSGDSLTVSRSTITDNEAEYGGGIYVDDGSVTIQESTISGNRADEGGGVYVADGVTTVRDSTISGNDALDGNGGGLYNDGATVSIQNSTISGNSATEDGGGLVNTNGGEMTIDNSTITDNTAGTLGGGIYLDNQITVNNSIVSGNTAPTAPDVYDFGNGYVDGTYNLFGPGNPLVDIIDGVNGNIVGTPALLGPLQNNGGPLETHEILAASRGVDEGDPAFDPNAFAPPMNTDERGPGFDRVANGRIEMGAFERQAAQPPPPPAPGPAGAWMGLLAALLGSRMAGRLRRR